MARDIPLAITTDIFNSLLYVTYRIMKIPKLTKHAPLCDACVKISSKRADSALLLRGQISSGECRKITPIFTYSACRQRANAATVSWGTV